MAGSEDDSLRFFSSAARVDRAEVEFDLTRQLGGAQQEALRVLLHGQGLLLFRRQSLCDDTGKRRLRRIAVADKTFFQLCPQFSIEDPRIIAWGSGATLMVD